MLKKMVVIVDYGMGNLRSVQKAAELLHIKTQVTCSKQVIKRAKKIIFPGVGHFGRAIKELHRRGIYKILIDKIKQGTVFFGICLGMQLLLEESEEAGGIKGLGVIRGKVRKFREKLVIPHMGWNRVKLPAAGYRLQDAKLFKGIKDNSYFYFAHSYYCQPEEGVVLSTTDYGGEFASSLHKGNIWAVQFHPEKSQRLGLKLFSSFLNRC